MLEFEVVELLVYTQILFSVYCKRFQKDKTSDEKKFEVDIEFRQLIDEAEQLLLSVEGIEMRVNRSIFVEGAFGILKQDFYYDRFRRRSLEKAKLEFMIMCLSLNVRKFLIYLNKKDNYTFKCWKAPEGTKPQVPKKTSAKRLTNRVNKKTPKSVNQASKDSYKYAKNE